MTTPTTEAGRRLFTDVDPMDMWESTGVTPDDIAAIEAEAVAADRARLAKIAAEQAEDEGLWFFAMTAPEAYLQQELRRLHAAIEEALRLAPEDSHDH